MGLFLQNLSKKSGIVPFPLPIVLKFDDKVRVGEWRSRERELLICRP